MAGYTQFQIEGYPAAAPASGTHRMFMVFNILAPLIVPALLVGAWLRKIINQ